MENLGLSCFLHTWLTLCFQREWTSLYRYKKSGGDAEPRFVFNGSTTRQYFPIKVSLITAIHNRLKMSFSWVRRNNLENIPQPQYKPTFDKWLNTHPSPEATVAVTGRLRETERKRKTWWWVTWLTSSLQAAQAGRAVRLRVAGSFSVWTWLHSLLLLCMENHEGGVDEDKKGKGKKKSSWWRHTTHYSGTCNHRASALAAQFTLAQSNCWKCG